MFVHACVCLEGCGCSRKQWRGSIDRPLSFHSLRLTQHWTCSELSCMGLVNGKEKEMGKFGFSFISSLPCCVSLKGEAWLCMSVYVFLLCVYCVRQTPAPLHVNYVWHVKLLLPYMVSTVFQYSRILPSIPGRGRRECVRGWLCVLLCVWN